MVYNMKSLSFFFCVWMDEWMDGCFFFKKKKGKEEKSRNRTKGQCALLPTRRSQCLPLHARDTCIILYISERRKGVGEGVIGVISFSLSLSFSPSFQALSGTTANRKCTHALSIYSIDADNEQAGRYTGIFLFLVSEPLPLPLPLPLPSTMSPPLSAQSLVSSRASTGRNWRRLVVACIVLCAILAQQTVGHTTEVVKLRFRGYNEIVQWVVKVSQIVLAATVAQEYHEKSNHGEDHVTSKTRKVISNMLKSRSNTRKQADDDDDGGGGGVDADAGSTTSHEGSNVDDNEPGKQSQKAKKRVNTNRKPSYCVQEVQMRVRETRSLF